LNTLEYRHNRDYSNVEPTNNDDTAKALSTVTRGRTSNHRRARYELTSTL